MGFIADAIEDAVDAAKDLVDDAVGFVEDIIDETLDFLFGWLIPDIPDMSDYNDVWCLL